VGDDGLDRASGERSLSGFELQFEPEWIDGGPADGQLTFGPARQDTAGEQATIGREGGVVTARDASTTPHLFGQLAYWVQEVHIVPAQLVKALTGRQRWCFEALVTHQAAYHRPILLFNEAAVILAIRPSAGKRDALGCAAAAVRANAPLEGLTKRDRLLVEITRALLRTRRLTDTQYAEAVAELGEPQLIELVALAGHYSLIGLTLGAFEVPPPDDLPANYTF
jgi:hypothetical protein